MDFEKRKKEMQTVIFEVSKYLDNGIDMTKLEFNFNDKGHDKPTTKKDCMYIYSFWHDDFDKPLKIGKDASQSKKRYKSYHYKPDSTNSTLAKSILSNYKMVKKYNVNEKNITAWMHNNLYRINIEMPFYTEEGFDIFTLELIEAILHYKYKPVFEGRNSQR